MPKLVLIKWHDAVSTDGWCDEDDEIESPHEIHTVGFLIHEDKEKIVVAMQIDLDRSGYSMTMSIPKPWILKRIKIK